MQKSAKIALIAVIVVIVGGGLAAWWYLSDDAPERASLRDRPATSDTRPASDPAAGPVEDPGSPEGVWTVRADSEVFAGYRVLELFANETVKKTAVGRTPAVTGTMTIEGTTITAIDVTADLTQLSSDQALRDGQLRTRGLQTDQFPEARFVLTEPVELDVVPQVGQDLSVTVAGDLTLHGVTRPVQVRIDARWNGTSIDVAGGTTIVMADFGIEPPNTPVVTVDPEGEMELQLTFVRA